MTEYTQKQPVPPAGTVRAEMGYDDAATAQRDAGALSDSDGAQHDTTVKKVASAFAPRGRMGQRYLASGKAVSMRLWEEAAGSGSPHSRPYETVGYVISGRAELHLEGQTVSLNAGDCWVVPKHARHRYDILEPLRAIEATSPPADVHGRDE